MVPCRAGPTPYRDGAGARGVAPTAAYIRFVPANSRHVVRIPLTTRRLGRIVRPAPSPEATHGTSLGGRVAISAVGGAQYVGNAVVNWPLKAHLQGNIWPGFNKPYQAFLFVTFPSSVGDSRQWLNDARLAVTSAEEVENFKQLRKLVGEHHSNQESRFVRSIWVNLAFTYAGLQHLRADGLGSFRSPFTSNKVPLAPYRDVHALIHVAADTTADVAAEVAEQTEILVRHFRGRAHVEQLDGNVLDDSREHFGYRDGLSQPALLGLDNERDIDDLFTPAERFIIPPGDGAGPVWAGHGSFLVFLQLEQHVNRFLRALDSAATQPGAAGLNSGQLGAIIVGRWPDGAPAGEDPAGLPRSEPTWSQAASRPSDLRFPSASHIGRTHPRGNPGAQAESHRLLRRGIPYGPMRRPTETDRQTPRGLLFVAYQASIAEQFEFVWNEWVLASQSVGEDVGSDPLIGPARAHRDSRHVVVPRKGGRVELHLPEFVTPRYGGYYFVPSLPALQHLAGASSRQASKGTGTVSHSAAYSGNQRAAQNRVNTTSTAWNANQDLASARDLISAQAQLLTELQRNAHEPTIVSTNRIADIRNFIIDQIPYAGVDPSNIRQGVVEIDGIWKDASQGAGTAQNVMLWELVNDQANYNQLYPRFIYWYFAGRPYSITKAIRMEYTYDLPPGTRNAQGVDVGGTPRTANLFIGYQGPPYP
jgi:Dyp-type peroxidase family